MSLKNFLKPNIDKILTFFFLIGISAVLVLFIPPFSSIIFQFFYAQFLFKQYLIIFFTVIIILLLAYIFACLTDKNKKRFRGIILYLFCSIIIAITVIWLISGSFSDFDNTIDGYCKIDAECAMSCIISGDNKVQYRAVNKAGKYSPPGFSLGYIAGNKILSVGCLTDVSAVCEHHQCAPFYIINVVSSNECERLADKTDYFHCYHHLAKKLKDETFCAKLDGYYQKNCYEDLALLKLDHNICKIAFQEGQKDHNLGKCYGQIAARSKNFAICDELTNYSDKNLCYADFNDAVIASQDSSLCDMAGNYKNECYQQIALQTLNASLCDFTSYPDNCYLIIAEDSGDETLCKKIRNIDWRERCYYETAQLTNNPELCNLSGSFISQCYGDTAYRLKDQSFCKKIPSDDLYGLNLCYQNIAIAMRDASLCNKVSDKFAKDLCLMSNSYYRFRNCDLPLNKNFQEECVNLVNQYAN